MSTDLKIDSIDGSLEKLSFGPIRDHNIIKAALSGTIRIDKQGNELLESVIVQNPQTRELEKIWTNEETKIFDPLQLYRAIWRVSEGAKDFQFTQWFRPVYWKLENPLDDHDLTEELPLLKDARWMHSSKSTQDSADKKSLVDENLLEAPNYWKGSIIEILSGANSGLKRRITRFNESNFKLSWDDDLPEISSTGIRYRIYQSHDHQIQSAWDELMQHLQGWLPASARVIDSQDLVLPLKMLSVSKVCTMNRRGKEDAWDLLATDYREEFSALLANLNAKVDAFNDGIYEDDNTDRTNILVKGFVR